MDILSLKKETYVKSDGRFAVYALGQSYAGVSSDKIVEVIRQEGVTIEADDRGNRSYVYYSTAIQYRYSPDNGQGWVTKQDEPRDRDNMLTSWPVGYMLDERNDLLLYFFVAYSNMEQDGEEIYMKTTTFRPFYQVSRDHGHTWEEPQQMIDSTAGFDSNCWAPMIEYGVRGVVMQKGVWLEDGALVVPMNIHEPNKPYRVICARGVWRNDFSGLDWQYGEEVFLPPDPATPAESGCCEPTVAALGGPRLLLAMRCEGNESKGIYSQYYTAYSKDKGMTWSEPKPFVYCDGSNVWTPASYSEFFRSVVNGNIYWIANILDHPVYAQEPRYPLCIARLDLEQQCLVKDSVREIQNKPDDAPSQRRYTNWGLYQDKKTGSLVITLPEQPGNKNWDDMDEESDMAADCVKYTINYL